MFRCGVFVTYLSFNFIICSSRFPQGRFPFDDSDDDMFGDLDMRSRMNRLGGFDWGAHKRGGGAAGFPDADAFFNQDPFGSAFPSGFGAATGAPQFDGFARAKPAGGARKVPHAHAAASPAAQTAGAQPQQSGAQQPNTDRSHFYDHLPDEFRQYFPESFGHSFPRMRAHHAAQSPPSGAGFVRQHQPQHPAQPEAHFVQQQQQPQASYQQVPQQQQQPQQPQTDAAPAAARPKLCDAAIQTDLLPAGAGTDLQQPAGLRNTVDMGQRSQQETVGGSDRAQSAPPTEQQTPSTNSGPYETATGAFANNTGTSMTPQTGGGGGVGSAQHSQFSYPTQQQQPQPQSTPTAGERHVPIFVEGRSSGSGATPPAPPQRQSQPPRPTPFVARDQTDSAAPAASAASSGDVPQTPHTADCIGKIQSIQSDVLDLMAAVDRFAGSRGDKEYKYIDEMLTRNLLKLDTIDTQGRESIRLARKEAIRCIQASITVLEAKAEQNSNREKAAAETVQPSVESPAAVLVAPAEAAGNIEQSLEDKLADFQRKSEERETAAVTAATALPASMAATITDCEDDPETHVSAVQIKLRPAGKPL